MRNSTTAGILIALLFCGSAEAQTIDPYRTAQEICLFSSFLPPAESPVALQTLLRDPRDGHDILDAFDTRLTEHVSNLTRTSGPLIIAPGSLLREADLFEAGERGSTGDHARDRILGTASGWTNLRPNSAADTADDKKVTFVVSGVPVVGLERNGYVAGFNLKF